MRANRLRVASFVALASAGLLVIAPAAGALPTVEGPIPGLAAGAAPYDPSGAGYAEEEYFVSGTAKTYTGGSRTAPFKVRMLVYRPTSPERFNGNAIVEWENVTGQVPGGHPMFAWLDSYALREGYVYVQVAAQATPAPAGMAGHGELGHVLFDPVRYGDLAHPGDDFSFDIFSQAMQAVTERAGADPVAGLVVERIVATGNSQSASRLHTYLELVQGEVNLADAVLLDAGGSKTFSQAPAVPTIHLLSEDGFSAAEPNQVQNYRLWEVAGASHNDADFGRNLNAVNVPGAERRSWAEQEAMFDDRHYGEQGLSAHATCVLGVGGNEFPRRYAVAAAVHRLVEWVSSGTPAPQPPRVGYDASARPVKDAYGNTVGGLRLPPIDVPVATYYGAACTLFGFNVPLDPITLADLYATHHDYVAQMLAATETAMADGYLLPRDADELMNLAERSSIGDPPGL